MLSTLRARMLFFFTTIVVSALLLTGGATYFIVRSSNLETIGQNLDSIANGYALSINEWVATRGAMVTATSQTITIEDKPTALTMVNQLYKAGDFFVATMGLSDKTAFTARAEFVGPNPSSFDPTSRPWYKQASEANKLVMTKPYSDTQTGKPLVGFALPLTRHGAQVGVMTASVSLAGVRDVVSVVHPTPSSFGFVVDANGNVLAHPDEKYSLKPASEMSAQLTPSVLSGLGQAKEAIEIEFNGIPKLLLAKPVRGTDWALVVALDKAEAMASTRSVLQTTAIAIVLVGLLAAAAVLMLTSTAFRRLLEVRDAMDEISSGGGDLSKSLPVIGRDEVAQIAGSFNLFVQKISAVLHQIREGSESVKVATVEIEAGNQDLSRRTEVAASNLQQTSAAMEQIVTSMKHSTDTARQASQFASGASAVAAQGGKAVGQVVTTMDDISASSRKIADIIGVIDGIAFQTNILALNAAVEAARAGEQGRGFAVVASEVRNLAQRSAQAAKEIKNLIGESVEKVEAGSRLVNDAGKTMGEIVVQVKRVTDLIGEITSSSTEQSSRISEVGAAVHQLDEVTQQNAALVEQSTAAAESLKQQAAQLAQTVGMFKLNQSTTVLSLTDAPSATPLQRLN